MTTEVGSNIIAEASDLTKETLSDEKLFRGLEYMLAVVSPVVMAMADAAVDDEAFGQALKTTVYSFVGGLGTNGYKIVKIDESS